MGTLKSKVRKLTIRHTKHVAKEIQQQWEDL